MLISARLYLQSSLLIPLIISGLTSKAILFIMLYSMMNSEVLAGLAINSAQRSIAIAIADEPPDLSSLTTTDSLSIMILGHVVEGLVGYDAHNQLSPAVAERWQIDDKGATFWLRKSARWSDGKPVTAHDFIFAWQTALAPKTGAAYASILYPIRNAEAINKGKMPVDKLGVVAKDDHTLVVSFEKPTPYFLGLTAFVTYAPIRRDFYMKHANSYGAEAEKILYNGPFVIDEWVHGASLQLKKNPHYWRRAQVKLDTIDIPYITSDPGARYNLFKAGSIAFAGLNAEVLKDALKNRYKIRRFVDGVLFFLEFNHRPNRITANLNLRRAIQAVLDPDVLVNKVIGIPGNIPGKSLFPKWLKGVHQQFRVEYPAKEVERDYDLARHYLAQAKQELGLESIPPLVFLTGDSPNASKEAEYFQRVLKRHLGIDLKIDKQIFKQRLARMKAGSFDIVSAGWGPDFDDPITFGNLFASWNENNHGQYRNSEYDRWVAVAENTIEPQRRMAAMAEMQRILIDEVALVPLYERGTIYLQHERLKGVARRIFGGDPYFGFAYIE